MQQRAQFSKSKVSCLSRHRGGNYYAVAKVGGKLIRRSLETDEFNTAKNRLDRALREIRGAKNARLAGTLGAAIQEEADRHDPANRRPATTIARLPRHCPTSIFPQLGNLLCEPACGDNNA